MATIPTYRAIATACMHTVTWSLSSSLWGPLIPCLSLSSQQRGNTEDNTGSPTLGKSPACFLLESFKDLLRSNPIILYLSTNWASEEFDFSILKFQSEQVSTVGLGWGQTIIFTSILGSSVLLIFHYMNLIELASLCLLESLHYMRPLFVLFFFFSFFLVSVSVKTEITLNLKWMCLLNVCTFI